MFNSLSIKLWRHAAVVCCIVDGWVDHGCTDVSCVWWITNYKQSEMSSTLTTNYKQDDSFFIYLQGLNYMYLNLHTRLYEKSCRLKKKDDDNTINKVPCLKTRWLLPVNPPFYFLKRALLIEVLLSVAKILLKIIVIQNKCSFCLQGNPSLLIADFIHC